MLKLSESVAERVVDLGDYRRATTDEVARKEAHSEEASRTEEENSE
jgi:hypothetical protein